jgi:8-oxo-dGTP pyrophosphatase MutT (NUDIX family)
MASLDIHKEAAAAAAHLEPEADREAAVLMIVCSVNGQPGVLYTKRAAHMFLHGGEISFPGGHFDDTCATSNGRGDKNLLDTALREAHEELQPLLSLLQPPHLTVLGQTSRIPSLKGTPVTPFLAVLWPNLIVAAASDDKVDNDDNDVDDNASSFGDATTTITTTTATTTTHDGIPSLSLEDYFDGDPKEVAAVFFVSLADLVRSETTHVLPVNRFGVTVAPCFPVAGQGNLWGLTAYITQPVLHRLLRPVFIEVSKSR